MIRAEFVTKAGGPAMPEIRKFMKELKAQMRDAQIAFPIEGKKVGDYAARQMARRVRELTRRAGAKGELAEALENSVKFRSVGTGGFQITMSSSDLPEYWAMINYGGFISPQWVPGFWADSPGGKSMVGGRTGEFVYVPGGGDEFGFMAPKKPIAGFHYIAYSYMKTIAYVRTHFSVFRKGKK